MKMPKAIYINIILFVLFSLIYCADENTNSNTNTTTTTGDTPCVRAGANNNAKTYDDCKSYSNETAETICCLVQGSSGGTDGTSCLDVDILFENKTIDYENNGISGRLICTSGNVNSGNYIIFSEYFSLFYLAFVLL